MAYCGVSRLGRQTAIQLYGSNAQAADAAAVSIAGIAMWRLRSSRHQMMAQVGVEPGTSPRHVQNHAWSATGCTCTPQCTHALTGWYALR